MKLNSVRCVIMCTKGVSGSAALTLQSWCWLHAHAIQSVFPCSQPTCSSDTSNVSLRKDKLHIFPQDGKPAVTEKGLYLQRHTTCSPTLYIPWPREEEVAQYGIQTWGEMVAITSQYSK